MFERFNYIIDVIKGIPRTYRGEKLKTSAEEGDPNIQYSAAIYCLEEGEKEEALSLLKDAAVKGHVDSQFNGNDLHSTTGNRYLKETFDQIHLHKKRNLVAPILLFQILEEDKKNYMKFLGLLVPGATDFLPTEDLVAVWRVDKSNRFQNYKSIFTILNEASIDLRWLDDLCDGVEPALSSFCPGTWKKWVEHNVYDNLECESQRSVRTLKDQKMSVEEKEILQEVFKLSHREFEFAAKEILRLTDRHLFDLEVTRSVKDRGIDIIGKYKIGQNDYSYSLKAVGEAKQWKNGIGVKPLMRLISKMTKDSIGFFVTTSYFGESAQEELIEDERPIVLICGKDIATILIKNELAGKGFEKNFEDWIKKIKLQAVAK